MTGKIFLTSCGLKEKQESEKLYNYLKSGFVGKKALIAINATLTGHNERAIAPTKDKFLSGGASSADIIILDKFNYKVISEYDYVYFVGGDIAPLAELVNEIDIRSEIVKFLEKGGIYIGESAGAIIMGKNVKWHYDVNNSIRNSDKKEPLCYDGLNIVNENIYPHFNNKPIAQKAIVEKYVVENGIKITPLNDGEWIEIDYKS